MPVYKSNRYVSVYKTVTNEQYLGSTTTVSDNLTWINSVSGEQNPRWRDQVRSGVNATTPLSGYREVRRHKPGYSGFSKTSTPSMKVYQDGSVNYHHLGLSSFPASMRSDANNRAVSKFVQRCIEAQSGFQGATFLGELKETLHMIKNPAVGLRRAIRSYSLKAKKLVRKLPKKAHTKALSETYLEGYFGWLPFVSDIQSGMKQLADFNPNLTQVVKAKAKVEQASSDHGTYTLTGVYCDWDTLEVHEASVWIKGIVKCTPSYLAGLPALSRWGFDPIRDFLPTVYEVIPWSFLADYFTNLGDIIQSYSFLKSNLTWCCRTGRDQTRARYIGSRHRYGTIGDWTTDFSWPEEQYVTRNVVYRDIPTTLVPEFTFQVPGYGGQGLAIAALLNERRIKL